MTKQSQPTYQALLLCAGKGVRMRSELPKVLHRVCGITILERVLRAAAAIQPEQITVVVGNREDLVRQEIEKLTGSGRLKDMPLQIVSQKEQRGTGHAVQLALPALSRSAERVLIIPGDGPLISRDTLREIQEGDRKLNFPDLVVVSCEPPSPFGYGRIVRDAQGRFAKIVEQKDCTPEQAAIREINSSVYTARLEFLDQALPSLRPDNAQGELYLTDSVSFGVKQGRRVEALLHRDALALSGANNRAELSQIEKARRAQINLQWMERGVTLEDPQATFIDEDVVLAEDCFVGAGTRLKGSTSIARGVVIDGNSFIIDSSIGASSHIKFNCVLESTQVAEECQVGPFARLRPGTKLHPHVHIGDFVETKNSELCEGAKANHLAYLGDAYVGAKVNVGAGTITCNYDGVRKSKTIIEERAFIGSNTSLVAPVTIGAGSIIGAGSVITRDVPADALALERCKQLTKEGWAKKKREAQKA